MFASVASGQATPADAAKEAERRYAPLLPLGRQDTERRGRIPAAPLFAPSEEA